VLSSHRLQSFYQPKIEQSKIQAEVSGLNNPGTSAFHFPVIDSQYHLSFALCFLSVLKRAKEQIGKKGRKEKSPETTYLQGKFNLITNVNKCFFLALYWDSVE